MSNRLFDILFSGSSTSVIPVKSMMSPKQESDIRQLFLDVVVAEGTLPKQRDSARGDSEEGSASLHLQPSDRIPLLPEARAVGSGVSAALREPLRTEQSLQRPLPSRSLRPGAGGFAGQYLLQFVLDERELVIQSDGSWQTRSGR